MKTTTKPMTFFRISLALALVAPSGVARSQDAVELAKARTVRIIESSLSAPESHPEFLEVGAFSFRIQQLAGGAFALHSSGLTASYNADGKTLSYLSFPNFRERWRGVTSDTPRVTLEDCQSIAKRVMELFCTNGFEPSTPVVKHLNDDEIEFSCSVSYEGMDFDTAITTMRLDRVSGCLTSLTMGFRSLPTIETGRTQPQFSHQALFAEAMCAYSSGHALAEGEVTKTQLALCVPDYANLANEMEPVHYQLVREDKAAAFYRVAIRGHEPSGTPAGRIVWVDAITGRAVAVQRVDLRGLSLRQIDNEIIANSKWQSIGSPASGEPLLRSFRIPQGEGEPVVLIASDGKTLVSGVFYSSERLLKTGRGAAPEYYFVPRLLALELESAVAYPPFGSH